MEFLQQLGKITKENFHISLNISATTGSILTKLSVLVVIYVKIIKLALVLRSLKGHSIW